MVAKIISYEEAPKDEPWQKRLLLVADDQEPIFEQMNEAVAALVPAEYSLIRGYLSEYTVSPHIPRDLTDQIIDEINQGVLMVSYAGHGFFNYWAHEKIFDAIRDIPSLSNAQRLPVMALMTCLNGYFLHPGLRSLGEEMLAADGAGAVAAFASPGMTCPQAQKLLDQALVEGIFQGGMVRLGPALAFAKQTLLVNSTREQDTANSFGLMGDPAMTLPVDPPPAVSAPVVAGGGSSGGGGCFVASAAYGSFLDHHVRSLRSFRDRWLLTQAVGRWLVKTYYALSPPAAGWIKGHQTIRALTRIALVPLVAVAQAELNRARVICLVLLLLISPLAWTHCLIQGRKRVFSKQ
jgi:hypothetical protein